MKTKLFPTLQQTIEAMDVNTIPADRKVVLQPLIDYIKAKKASKKAIRLNFICTHNSRRSHLSQIWAQTMSYYFGVTNVHCYSGGTEATAMFYKVGETLGNQGFQVLKLSEEKNPVYAIKYAETAHPVICFSKTYDADFNPKSDYGAIMTCDSANEACPMVLGSEARFPITYKDPKAFDNTPEMDEKYLERSVQIATELFWVFQSVVED